MSGVVVVSTSAVGNSCGPAPGSLFALRSGLASSLQTLTRSNSGKRWGSILHFERRRRPTMAEVKGVGVDMSLHALSAYFDRPQKDAAKDIGFCVSSLKKLCRSHGLVRWPYRKVTACFPTPVHVTLAPPCSVA